MNLVGLGRILSGLLLGLFGIDVIAGEGGTIDRAIDSPTGKIGYALVIGIIIVALLGFVKGLNILK